MSEFEIPTLEQCYIDYSDVLIKFGSNPFHLSEPSKTGVLFEACPNDFLFNFSSVGSFRVHKGKEITIQPEPHVTPMEISLFLVGSIMGALLHQRGMLPLHGSTININHGALTIIGFSSVGKSSLANGLLKEGFSVLSDDVSAITHNEEHGYIVQPGPPYLKLWEDVLNYHNQPTNLANVRSSLNKFYQPLNKDYYNEPLRLGVVICLERKNSLGFELAEIKGVEKFNLIRTHTYRNQYLTGVNILKNHFQQITNLSNQIKLYRIQRPEAPLMIDELVELIKEKIIQEK